MASALQQHAADLAWSLWAELGVPGVVRSHGAVAIDLEPLIVQTPWLARHDARLRDEAFRWCAAHSTWVSASRLQGLSDGAAPDVREAFGALAATLRLHHGVRWPVVEGATPWPRPPAPRPPRLDPTRPSLVRLRLRAATGVGTRADVLAELFAASDRWLVASDLRELGFTKRNVAQVLAKLSEAGLLRQRRSRNALAFQLADPGAWTGLFRAAGLAWPDWPAVLAFALQALALDALREKPEPVRRVEEAKALAVLEAHAARLALPPHRPGHAGRAGEVTQWATRQLEALAQGTANAFRPR